MHVIPSNRPHHIAVWWPFRQGTTPYCLVQAVPATALVESNLLQKARSCSPMVMVVVVAVVVLKEMAIVVALPHYVSL